MAESQIHMSLKVKSWIPLLLNFYLYSPVIQV